MYLKSLELTGFKSFAQKTALTFSTRVTAVVGPNGSGKSNIAEAFRFVLGEQSIKSMRGKRTEDLIWNGGRDAGRANRASVKVVFDNRDRILNIDFDEVSIERVVYRDASSEYYISGSQVRLKDIAELLAGAHIGSSGHHIISQGEADKMLNANSKERRDMLEDALGLKVYQYKREESERKLGKTEENMKSVESLRKEIAPHLKFLKKQVEKVEKTFELKDALRTLCKEYFKREETYTKHEREKLVHERTQPEEDLKRLHAELAEAKHILAKSDTRDATSTEIIELENKLSQTRSEKDTLMHNLGRLEGAISSEERIIRREKELLTRDEHRHVPLAEVEAVAHQIEGRLKAVEVMPDETTVHGFFNFLRGIFADFIKKHKAQTTSDLLAQSEVEILRLQQEKESFGEKLKAIHEREGALNSAYRALRHTVEREKDSNREAEKAVFRIMSEENSVRSILAGLQSREERILLLEEDFKRSLHEAGMLLGRDVLDFEHAKTVDGAPLTRELMLSEERHAQEERKRTVEKMKIRIEEAGAGGGEEVIREYKEVSERDAFLERELADLAASAVSLAQLIKELELKLDTEFREGVKKINEQFGNFFTLMFGGGSAKLEVIRSVKNKKSDTDLSELGDVGAEVGEEQTDTEEGIEIEVNLPRKKIKGLMMLSGGERALTSIALLFAISQVNPPPFVILDETDAALDEANSRKYGDMIESLSKLSQLILITHNRETMSRAGVLYGVTMNSGGNSKLLSIAFEEAVAVAK